jgi:hypothetical protein
MGSVSDLCKPTTGEALLSHAERGEEGEAGPVGVVGSVEESAEPQRFPPKDSVRLRIGTGVGWWSVGEALRLPRRMVVDRRRVKELESDISFSLQIKVRSL